MTGDLPKAGSESAVVVMGVCGAGKSRLARRLSECLGVGMVEADDFHSPANKRKMSAGEALTDADRMPWLDAVAMAARLQLYCTGGAVVACSSLKRAYRERLRASLPACRFIHLSGPRALIAERLANRQGHFVGETLLDSQLATLEPLEAGETGFTLEISRPVDTLVDIALEELRQAPPPIETIAS
ncbi:gluconokinase [Roseibium sediminicola]|uniref:Gluconokinase n=1 Tax=Roseibium sediminicola TaxID=2933272 RepID=A0ABT0H122_9HYPH|nr:gluconokinase [Roseibium sp. CAU 1639]MCK7615391.1 gluconokinase [Roseibium sp. CAU 1639]